MLGDVRSPVDMACPWMGYVSEGEWHDIAVGKTWGPAHDQIYRNDRGHLAVSRVLTLATAASRRALSARGRRACWLRTIPG